MKKLVLLFILAFSLGINAQVKDSTKVDNFQKTDEVLSEVVKKALTVAEKTGDFVIEQAPLLLQEFYNWHIYSNIFYILIGLIIIIFGIWLSLKFKKYLNKDYILDHPCPFFTLFFSIIIGGLFILISGYDLIFLLSAPKLYLIEYFIK